MNNQILLKSNFIPPRKIEISSMTVEVLGPKHNQMDFDAWTSSLESLKGIFGPRNGWPGEVDSLEHNLKDLENHLREFEEKEAFAYSLLNKDETICVGCLYIRPSKTNEFNWRVDFWFSNSHKKLEENFYSWLKDWLRIEWGFEKVAFPGRSISWQKYYQLIEDK